MQIPRTRIEFSTDDRQWVYRSVAGATSNLPSQKALLGTVSAYDNGLYAIINGLGMFQQYIHLECK